MRRALAVAAKDLRSDARAKEIVPTMVLFALVLVFLFTFPLPPGSGRVPVPEPRAGAVSVREVSAAFLWASLLFAGVVGFGRSASTEREDHRIEGLLLAPVDPAALYAGKLAANLVYLAAMEVVLLPAFIVFLDVPPGRLFPEIAFPAMLPVVLGAIRLTSTLFASGGFGGQASWFALLGAIDIAYLAIGTVTFEYVLTE